MQSGTFNGTGPYISGSPCNPAHRTITKSVSLDDGQWEAKITGALRDVLMGVARDVARIDRHIRF